MLSILSVWRGAALAEDLQTRSAVHAGPIVVCDVGGEKKVQQASHGGFDNDIDVVSRTMSRILGLTPEELPLPVDDLRGF